MQRLKTNLAGHMIIDMRGCSLLSLSGCETEPSSSIAFGDREISSAFQQCRHARAHKQAAMCSRVSAGRSHTKKTLWHIHKKVRVMRSTEDISLVGDALNWLARTTFSEVVWSAENSSTPTVNRTRIDLNIHVENMKNPSTSCRQTRTAETYS